MFLILFKEILTFATFCASLFKSRKTEDLKNGQLQQTLEKND